MDSLTIIIPARLGATRFPRKMLHPVLDKPLILWTVEAASRSKKAGGVIVATDDEEILKLVTDAGFDARMTRSDHPSGTDRVWEIASGLQAKWIINLQGDEPLMTADALDSLADVAFQIEDRNQPVEMVTLIGDLDPEDARDPNRVKVVTDLEGNALYFSRSPIPYPRIVSELSETGQDPARYLLHVGVYLYRRDVLERLVSLKRSPLERVEGLEQLRALENGIRIKCVHADHEFLGVDVQTDVPRVEAILRARAMEGSGGRDHSRYECEE
jgi:3-deoxy-manno-octulosonate cytidylyltransferase (CMP-KDO synthetase)